MPFKAIIKEALTEFLKHRGQEIVPTKLVYEWQRSPIIETCHAASELPNGAAQFLKPNNPQLIDLQDRYAAFDSSVTNSVLWGKGHVRVDDIAYFRQDNAYVWQLRGTNNLNILGYALAYYYAKSMDRMHLLVRLTEDNLFGSRTFIIDGRVISRDLIDSILEIHFLESHLQLSTRTNLRILDIGAGYGRLAHRIIQSLENIRAYICADAIAVSTFICDYYLGFRGVAGRARAIPLDQIQQELNHNSIDVAVNIHSFSECTLSAISWWSGLL